MILSIPIKNSSTPEMVDPFFQNGKGNEVKDGGDEIKWVMDECCGKRDEPDDAEDEGVEGHADSEDETAFGSYGMGMADVEEPA